MVHRVSKSWTRLNRLSTHYWWIGFAGEWVMIKEDSKKKKHPKLLGFYVNDDAIN